MICGILILHFCLHYPLDLFLELYSSASVETWLFTANTDFWPRTEGTPFDIEDFGVVLSAGITCPKHGWSFDLFTGRADRNNYMLRTVCKLLEVVIIRVFFFWIYTTQETQH